MAEFHTLRPLLGLVEPVARKTAAQENFPVASRLLPRHLRPHVKAFYAFVRLADDIADDPNLEPETKLAHLDALDRALMRGEAESAYLRPALELRTSLESIALPPTHARQMLHAFRRDARNESCRTWGDLMLYCRHSAVPVGRFLLALHGEGQRAFAASDALCAALQILNHIQDCRSDWCDLGRCYIPRLWFDQAGLSQECLVERRSAAALRVLFDRMLDQVDALLVRSRPLPRSIRHSRLRLEAAVILSLAEALTAKLRRADPLTRHVSLSVPARLAAAVRGVVRGLRRA